MQIERDFKTTRMQASTLSTKHLSLNQCLNSVTIVFISLAMLCKPSLNPPNDSLAVLTVDGVSLPRPEPQITAGAGSGPPRRGAKS